MAYTNRTSNLGSGEVVPLLFAITHASTSILWGPSVPASHSYQPWRANILGSELPGIPLGICPTLRPEVLRLQVSKEVERMDATWEDFGW